jgi:hypothetical protein
MAIKVASIESGIPGLDRGALIDATSEKAKRERRRALVVPREHGGWGLLLVPLITGAGVGLHEGNRVLPLFLLLVSALALFWLRTPIESLLRTSVMRAQTSEERRAVASVIAVLGLVASLSVGLLSWDVRNRGLWPIGLVVGVAFAGQAVLKRLGRTWRMLSQVVGTIGLSATAPAAYYVITGSFGTRGWMLWLANFAFAGNQIHYVQLRIHSARAEGWRAKLACGWAFAAGQVIMVSVLAGAWLRGWLPPLAIIAFVPMLFRGWRYFFEKPRPLVVRQLGWSELGQAVVFCALFTGAFLILA